MGLYVTILSLFLAKCGSAWFLQFYEFLFLHCCIFWWSCMLPNEAWIASHWQIIYLSLLPACSFIYAGSQILTIIFYHHCYCNYTLNLFVCFCWICCVRYYHIFCTLCSISQLWLLFSLYTDGKVLTDQIISRSLVHKGITFLYWEWNVLRCVNINWIMSAIISDFAV